MCIIPKYRYKQKKGENTIGLEKKVFYLALDLVLNPNKNVPKSPCSLFKSSSLELCIIGFGRNLKMFLVHNLKPNLK